ncbi:MAG: peroxide stress protein YaaA [Solirubrobacterales bacterium]
MVGRAPSVDSRRADPATSFRGQGFSLGRVLSRSRLTGLCRVPEPEAGGVDRCSGKAWQGPGEEGHRGAGHFEGPGRGHRAGRRTTQFPGRSGLEGLYRGAVRPAWPRFPPRGREAKGREEPADLLGALGLPRPGRPDPLLPLLDGRPAAEDRRPARLLAGVAPRGDGGGRPRQGGNLVLDMRSGAYSAAWKPKQARLVTVRGFTEAGGRRKAISHMAKAVRGDVARIALSAKSMPKDPETLAGLLEAGGMTVELTEKTLDVIEQA